jgi:CRISPR/Cas system-associated endonuclease Cas1
VTGFSLSIINYGNKDGTQTFHPGAHRLRLILVEGRAGASVTTAAVFWMIREKVELLMTAPDDITQDPNVIAMFAPVPGAGASRAALKFREAQFRAALDPAATARFAKAIVAKKIAAEGHPVTINRLFMTNLRQARTTDDIRHIEAKSAQLWWKQWEGFEMHFAGAAAPAEWRSWPDIPRRQGKLGELGAQFTARGGVHPIQSMQNYSIGVLAARMTRVIIAKGLDGAFGFLHDGRKPGRLSLVWDMVEPFRPALATAVFRYIAGAVFRRDDFKIAADGVIKISPETAREVAALVIRTVSLRAMVQEVDWLVRLIKMGA